MEKMECKEIEIFKKEFIEPFEITISDDKINDPDMILYIVDKIKKNKIVFDSDKKEVLIELKEPVITAKGTEDETTINEVIFTTKNCQAGKVRQVMESFEKDQTDGIALFTGLSKKQIGSMVSSDFNSCAQMTAFFLIY